LCFLYNFPVEIVKFTSINLYIVSVGPIVLFNSLSVLLFYLFGWSFS
jgi:hypothetical protein